MQRRFPPTRLSALTVTDIGIYKTSNGMRFRHIKGPTLGFGPLLLLVLDNQIWYRPVEILPYESSHPRLQCSFFLFLYKKTSRRFHRVRSPILCFALHSSTNTQQEDLTSSGAGLCYSSWHLSTSVIQYLDASVNPNHRQQAKPVPYDNLINLNHTKTDDFIKSYFYS